MLEDDIIPEPPEDSIADVEMNDDASEDVPPPEAAQQGTDEEQTPPPADEPAAETDITVPVAPLEEPDSSFPPGEEPPTREATVTPEAASSTLRTESTPEPATEVEPDIAPVVAAPQPSNLAGATKSLITRLSSVVLSAESDPVREGTASPVSSMLDPRLQDLAISVTPAESSASPAQSSSTNSPGTCKVIDLRHYLMLHALVRKQSLPVLPGRNCARRSPHLHLPFVACA